MLNKEVGGIKILKDLYILKEGQSVQLLVKQIICVQHSTETDNTQPSIQGSRWKHQGVDLL